MRVGEWIPVESIINKVNVINKVNAAKRRRKVASERTVVFLVEYLGICGCIRKPTIRRRIELLESQTLDDLHEAIIYKAFNWYDPHLYSFFMDGKPYGRDRSNEYSCDENEDYIIDPWLEKPKSTKVRLRNLKLKAKQKFLFLFDFGDDQQFRITVEGFREAKEGKRYPLVLERKGRAPQQYGRW